MGSLRRLVAVAIVVASVVATATAAPAASNLKVSPDPVLAGDTIHVTGFDPGCAAGYYNWRFMFAATEDTIAFGTSSGDGAIDFSAEAEARFAGGWLAEVRCSGGLVLTKSFTVYLEAPPTTAHATPTTPRPTTTSAAVAPSTTAASTTTSAPAEVSDPAALVVPNFVG